MDAVLRRGVDLDGYRGSRMTVSGLFMVQYRMRAQSVLGALRKDVLSGGLEPGQDLSRDNLAARLHELASTSSIIALGRSPVHTSALPSAAPMVWSATMSLRQAMGTSYRTLTGEGGSTPH
jgi:hypothetical protein